MGKRLDLTGQRFGRLVVLGFSHLGKYGGVYWNTECDCGNLGKTLTANLTRKKYPTSSCGCIRRSNLTGKRFKRLVVLAFSHIDKGKKACWKCQCDCGQIVVVRANNLKSKKTKSCGCLQRETVKKIFSKPKGEKAFNILYHTYKYSAEVRAFIFALGKEQFREIISQSCFYCGQKPLSRRGAKYDNSFHCNGIDRIENTKGYIFENVVPCCEKCNRMKLAHTQKDFLTHVERIHKHQHNSK